MYISRLSYFFFLAIEPISKAMSQRVIHCEACGTEFRTLEDPDLESNPLVQEAKEAGLDSWKD